MENFTATIYNPSFGSHYCVPISAQDIYTAEAIARATYGDNFQYISRC